MKNLIQLPWSGKGSKAKNDNTLGLMHVGIRSRIGSMSLKNTSLFGVILTLLLTLGVGEMWADYTWSSGNLLYYDFTAVTSGGVNWHDGSSLQYDASGSGKVKRVEFSSNVTMSTSWVIAKTSTGGWADIKFSNPPSANQRRFIINSDGKNGSWGYYDKYIAGDNWGGIGEWSTTTKKMTNGNDGSYSVTLNSVAASAHKFKVTNYDTWTGAVGYSSNVSCVNGTVADDGTNDHNSSFTPSHAGNVIITYNCSTGKIVIQCPYQVSYAAGTGASGSVSASAVTTYGSTCTLSSSTFTKAGYTQDGWATSDGGDKVYNLGATYTGGYTDVTLYPHWAENMSSVSLVASPSGKGSFTIGGAAATSTTAGVTTTRSVTAVPISGYHFVSWAVTGGASVTSTTTNPTTLSGDGSGDDATLTATFAADDSYSLTVVAGTGISAVTGNTNDIKVAQNISISATVTDGYTWSTWTKTAGSGTLSTFTAGTKNQTVTVGTAGDITLTASASEKMSALTTSCSYSSGSPGYAIPTKSASSIGIVTTSNLSATAPGAAYTFTGWTLKHCVRTDGGADDSRSITVRSDGSGSAATAVANYTAKTPVRLYYTNPEGWSTIKAYVWENGNGTNHNADWSGAVITSNTVTQCGSTYYYYEYYKEDHPDWNRVIFNNGSAQTSDIIFSSTDNNNQYNNASAGGTGSWSATPPARWALSGTMNTWSTSANMFTCDDGTLTLEIDLNANSDYNFKVLNVPENKWYGTASATKITYDNQTTAQTISQENGAEDAYQTMRSAAAGTYTFTWDPSDKKVKVSYPTSYKVELEVGTVKGNKQTPGIYVGSYDEANKIASGSYVSAGAHVIFVVASSLGNAAKAGYTWWGFFDNAAGDDPTKYTNGSTTTYHINPIDADAHVYAVFGENNYTVKIINNGNGDVYEGGSIVTATTAHVATASNTLTATPQTGYKFDNWDQFSDSLTINSASTAATTIKIKSDKLGDNARLRANYSPRWSVVGTDAFDGWSAYSTNLFTGYTKVSTKDVGYKTITLAANTSYEIKVYDRANSTLYGGSANQTIDYAHSGAGNEYTIATTSSPKSVFIQSAAGGTYTLNWNLTDKKIAVVYPTSWYITTGVNDALGGSFTAVDNSSNNVYGGKFVANSANVVFTATPNTGYNFSDWYSNSTCTTPYTAGTGVAFSGEGNTVMTLSGITADKTVYAKFTAKTYTVTLTRNGTGYGSGGTASVTATYNATLPAATMPTAANGYAFMGYYTEADGEGSQVINASGVVQTVDGYTDADKKWKRDAATELFAYFKQAEITELTLDNAMVAPSTTITVTPTIAPTPTGTVAVCYELQYSNGTPLPSQPEFSSAGGYAVSFTAPAASATYKVQAKLCLNNCSGTVLDTEVASFQVAGEHTVTVQYQDADGRTLKASTEITGRPLAWTTLGDITPPTITGYTFARWDAGDGVTIKNGDLDPVTTTTTSSIQIKAVYDGTLTAVYNKKRLIYFYNTLNWSNVYVYFYKNNSYWNNSYGTGADNTYTFTNTPYSEQKHGQMLPIEEGSKIYYFDAEAAGVNASYTTVAFTELNQHGYGYFAQTDGVNNKVIRRDDYKSTTMPMYVPLADQTPTTMNGGLADYYNKGYWMNYPENTGYTLKIYDAWNATKETAAVRSFAFPYSGDLKMPLKMDVEFNEANHDYWFMIYRNDGTYLGNTYNFKQGWNEEQEITGGDNKSKITTSAPGNYTLTLTYHDENYYIDVDFPIASGDYRIYYSDNATWSQGAHTKNSWNHPSHSIAKATTEAKKDTVSFFIPKGVGISHTMKFQKASVTNEGVVSWSDVDGGGITIPSSITESGVYNFIVSQPAGGASISLEKVEPYTGNFYIRTDCAGNTKWDSFKNADHQMTYSDYAENHSGYSHYYAHWVESGNNVSFTIANDYSMCISDTLFEDYGTTIANISNTGALNSGNASIRFMWNQSTNKISRAYISGSSNISDRFLVLEGDAKMFDENGKALTEAGGGKISGLNDYEMNLVDDQNFVYERTIKLQTTARGRLSAKYNNNTQYFIGSSGDFAEGTTVELLGGTASATKYSMRIVYDFKTNRLVNAYIPSGSDITENLAINADIMLVREHQNAGQQLTFDGGSLSKVQTVYGVMRFNRWTLNNKETTGGHSVVGDPKSAYERSLYWISFPFDVNLSDVFGFGTYGTDWIIQEYDGAERAAKGYWADSEGFWKYITNRRGVVLEAGKGYVLALDLDRMKDNNTSFWANNIEQVELFFPSAAAVENIQETDTEIDIPAHECTIAPRPGQTDDRRKKDSHWNIIGVPSYANYGETLKDGEDATITWNDDPETKDLPFLYEWNMVDNTYSVQSGTTYPFKSMHAYMVQYNGKLKWSLASATPPASPVVARHADAPQNIEFRLELQAGEKTADQTFVKMTTDEQISTAFDFNYDLSKQMNSGKANIYTMVEGYIQTAGNCLPMSEQTTVVPVGVKIATDGDYTFAIPEGTEGVGVTLIDQEIGIRTSLSALAYTVSLEAGTYNERFVLEISPIQHIATEIETSDIGDQKSDVRKLLIDGLLYMVRDGKVYDARGARIE